MISLEGVWGRCKDCRTKKEQPVLHVKVRADDGYHEIDLCKRHAVKRFESVIAEFIDGDIDYLDGHMPF